MKKDLEICLDEVARNGAALHTTREIDGVHAEIEVMGGNRWDTSSLLARLEARYKGKA